MIISSCVYFEDADSHTLEICVADGGAITIYSHGEIVTITADAIPALLAAIQHAGDLAAMSEDRPAPEAEEAANA